MKELYLDKKDILKAHWKPIAAGLAAVLLLGVLPFFRDTLKEPFVLEPAQRAVLRAQVAGRVVAITAGEGQRVAPGTVIASLRDLGLSSQTARKAAEYRLAEARAFDAWLRSADYAGAEQKRRESEAVYRLALDKEKELTVASPIAGVVVTPRAHNLLGSYLNQGDEIAEVADTSSVRARIFVPSHEWQKLQQIHDVVLRVESHWAGLRGQVVSISPASQAPDAGLFATPEYKGIRLPEFFVVTVALANSDGALRDGMTGLAKIRGPRRSLFGILLEPAVAAAARRLW